MATPKKILYLTADYVATSAELAEIATLKEIAEAEYELLVACGKPKASLTGITLSVDQSDNSLNDSGATITASTISASSTDNSISDSGNGFIAAGFQVGDAITVTGFTHQTANNATRIATSVAQGKIIFAGTDGDSIVTENASEAVTMTAPGRFLLRGFKAGQYVMARGWTTSANNTNSGLIESVTAGKMIIAGAAGAALVTETAGDTVTISTTETAAYYGDVIVTADYLAGTVTEAYKSSGTPVYTVMDPANPPDPPSLIDTQTVLSSGETIALDTAGTVTVTVAAGAVSAADVEADESVVTDADTLALTTAGTVTFAVADHVLTGDVAATEAVVADGGTVAVGSDDVTLAVTAHAVTGSLPATKTIVENGDTVTVDGATVTLAVGTGAITGGTLAETKCVVSDGDTVTVDGSSVTLGVAANAVTGGTLASTKCVVTDNDTVSVGGQTCTLTVAANDLVSGALPATATVITTATDITITSGSGTSKVTLTVAGGVVTACVLS